MAETGIARFQGSLDPTAQEFRPRTQHQFQQQIHIFGPPPPPPPPPPPLQLPLYYPYTPISLGFPPPQPAYVNTTTAATVPSLPPQSAAPTRTLVLSSVPSHVSESIIRRELETFGEVRGVQMERIHDGIVTVHFYDLRHAEIALKEIREKHMQQQTRLRNLFVASPSLIDQSFGFIGDSLLTAPPHTAARGLIAGCAVWAQFIIPSSNAVPDGHNHGTIVVFNLDPTISTPTLKEIFQAFGAVKELRETPLKKQQRFVEFYDVRDAAKALKEMNGKEIHGKQVVIEFSRPGGFGRKFFNATNFSTCSKTSSSIHNSFINAKLSSFSLPPQPPQRQLPPPTHSTAQPPVQRSSHNIPQRAFQTSNFTKASPNDETSNCSKDKIEVSFGCLSINGGDGNGVVDGKYGNGFASRRNSHAKKNQINDSAATTSTTSSTTTTTKHQNRSKPWKTRQAKKFDTRFLINEDAMVESNCSDSRTTVMIKNIPNKYSQKLLLNMLDNHCIHCNEQIIADGGGGEDHPLSSYDFVYLPIDFNNKCNVGYGFVNMTSPQATLRLYKAFHHQHWEVFNSRKICEVTYARVQGLEALKEHFKNSKFPCEMDHYLPVVFSPPRDGRQLSEPQPIAGHGQKQQQSLVIFGLDIKNKDGENSLDNSNNSSGRDTDQDQEEDEEEEEEEESLNRISCSGDSNSSSQNGGDIGVE